MGGRCWDFANIVSLIRETVDTLDETGSVGEHLSFKDEGCFHDSVQLSSSPQCHHDNLIRLCFGGVVTVDKIHGFGGYSQCVFNLFGQT